MCTQKSVVISLILILLATSILYGCGGDKELDNIDNFSKVIKKENLDELSLTIYIDPTILTLAPLSVDKLISFDGVNKFVINGSDLKKHIDLFEQISKDDLIPVKKRSYINARVYYVFETEKEGKILDVVMWGNNNSVFVNGLEVKWNDIFYDIIMPFLTEEAKNDMESYLGI